ncbi:MAG: hypothetical protein HYY60_01055, partial [Parcubacteria group bacterium]|nr:hypothetical protein [Parcubacteria group bacterium]
MSAMGYHDYYDYFKGKKITLMGLGLLGRGVGDAAFIASCGAQVLVTDKKSAKELAPSLHKLKKYSSIRFALGGHDIKDFCNADMVIKAAGIPLNSPYIKEAVKNKIPVYMSTALFVKLLPPDVTVVGITGTRGKTTTAFLIYEILKKQFPISNPVPERVRYGTGFQFPKKKNPKVFLGGNIQGISTLALLPKVKSGDFVVLELDSWQLQGFADLKISPQIAVFSTFLSDHMNYYEGSMRRYFADKAGIFKYQKVTDESTKRRENYENLIVGEQVMPFVKKREPKHARRAIAAR